MTNSADPDQLASSEANWSGSTLFGKTGHVVFSKKRGEISNYLSVYQIPNSCRNSLDVEKLSISRNWRRWQSTPQNSLYLTSVSGYLRFWGLVLPIKLKEKRTRLQHTKLTRTPRFLIILIPKFEQTILLSTGESKVCWMSGKQCRLRSDAAFCGIYPWSTLSVQTCQTSLSKFFW